MGQGQGQGEGSRGRGSKGEGEEEGNSEWRVRQEVGCLLLFFSFLIFLIFLFLLIFFAPRIVVLVWGVGVLRVLRKGSRRRIGKKGGKKKAENEDLEEGRECGEGSMKKGSRIRADIP